ncbi:VOC family protein [Streptomyces thermoalcalitolerans]|uniref:VOC family protein n=1 Tax=Streptomyces thermoalcalitolerans TaxID=65605 RepID=UPI0031D268E6
MSLAHVRVIEPGGGEAAIGRYLRGRGRASAELRITLAVLWGRLEAGAMQLTHLGLPVRDEQTSRRFYCEYFGFDPASAQRYDDGTVIIRNSAGFDLALHAVPGEIGSLPDFLHFGFRLSEPAEVRSLLGRLAADGVEIIEQFDESGLVSFKCLDPDGHRVEVYWEAPVSGE